MYKYDLKNNPELAKERHRQQNREWYKKHKEQKMAYQKEYRAKKKFELQETQVQYGYVGVVASDGKLHTIYPNKKDEK